MAIDLEVLREAQLIMLDMLVEFDAICKKHKLQYWLDSGTLLGAVRHKGFIPWDDDIDISMPIEDYEKFMLIAANELSKDIFFQTQKSDNEFKFDYIKLRSNRAKIVEFHEANKDINYHQGVFIDIFPMITLPNKPFFKEFYDDIFILIRKVSAVSLHTPNGISYPKQRAKLVEAINSMHQGWQKKDLKVAYGGQMPDLSAWFTLQEVFPLSKIEFEGLEFSAPKNPHHYLESIYKFNYMELPPLEGRKIHAKDIIIA